MQKFPFEHPGLITQLNLELPGEMPILIFPAIKSKKHGIGRNK